MQENTKEIYSINTRVLNIIDYLGLTRYKFAQETGISESVLLNIYKGKNKVSIDVIEKILNKYSVISPMWLISGHGSMIYDNNSAIQVSPGSKTGIPLVSTEAAAGFGTAEFAIKDEDIQNRYLVPDFNGIDFMIRVKGGSMYPKYSSGDIIACRILNDSNFIQWNKCHVIATREQGLLVKRLKKGHNDKFILAISDNKEYDPFEIPTNQITGIALVIGVIRLE